MKVGFLAILSISLLILSLILLKSGVFDIAVVQANSAHTISRNDKSNIYKSSLGTNVESILKDAEAVVTIK